MDILFLESILSLVWTYSQPSMVTQQISDFIPTNVDFRIKLSSLSSPESRGVSPVWFPGPSISVAQELIRSANSWAPTQTQIRRSRCAASYLCVYKTNRRF